jgi:hypothetical protein
MMARDSHLPNAAVVVDLGRSFESFNRARHPMEGLATESRSAEQTVADLAAAMREFEANEHARAVVEHMLGRCVRRARWSGRNEITAEEYGDADQVVVQLVVG